MVFKVRFINLIIEKTNDLFISFMVFNFRTFLKSILIALMKVVIQNKVSFPALKIPHHFLIKYLSELRFQKFNKVWVDIDYYCVIKHLRPVWRGNWYDVKSNSIPLSTACKLPLPSPITARTSLKRRNGRWILLFYLYAIPIESSLPGSDCYTIFLFNNSIITNHDYIYNLLWVFLHTSIQTRY